MNICIKNNNIKHKHQEKRDGSSEREIVKVKEKNRTHRDGDEGTIRVYMWMGL